jgi:ketosteroid isomerase-like protein
MSGDAESVRAANQRFYDALSSQSMLAMEQVWAHAPEVRCVHQGAAVLEGWEAIRESWRAIFAHAICLTVVPRDPKVTVVGPTAIVTCREQIASMTLDGSTIAAAQATNVFAKHAGHWHLIHRHSSALGADESPGAR